MRILGEGDAVPLSTATASSHNSEPPADSSEGMEIGSEHFDGGGAEGELGWLERARARTAEVLQERKKMKRRLGLAAQKFNSGSKGWLQYAQVLCFFVGFIFVCGVG